MTAKGSVTPWMACGSRPVERAPEPGVFPTVGINRRPGVKGAGPFAPLPPPPTAGWQITQACQGRDGPNGNHHAKALPISQKPNRRSQTHV